MIILEQHHHSVYNQIVVSKNIYWQFWVKGGGVLMVLPQKLHHVYIIVNIFVNTQSILKNIAS